MLCVLFSDSNIITILLGNINYQINNYKNVMNMILTWFKTKSFYTSWGITNNMTFTLSNPIKYAY